MTPAARPSPLRGIFAAHPAFEIPCGNADNRDLDRKRQMRIVFALLLMSAAFVASAQAPGDRGLPTDQSAQRKPPAARTPQLQPLPEPPPPPPGLELDPALEPQ